MCVWRGVGERVKADLPTITHQAWILTHEDTSMHPHTLHKISTRFPRIIRFNPEELNRVNINED